ncbi:hypothetical protein ST201phi2-1p254 [Pseudomonas phage 201phi2-1]|uniref:Uncharacterized protein n=1 Tax=Pseudomonas phage 201phi2-1 TaxID=198110 RepID=B3FJB6_BP201|nr:hypothetical protein ST201phi2-1p254 [Pseudomonas phage 201phi2-1]ABY63082.1 hypothetical protein 201phi2-1p254 [Pseudomonas phage 201phi2-1]
MKDNWYNRVKKAVQENIPVIVTIGTTVAAVAAVMYAKDELDETVKGNNELLKTIEEKIAIAIESPTIVKVEIGDEIELFGTGNRTD